MSKFSFNFTSVDGETKDIPDTHTILPIWWQTEVNELFVRYWAVVPADSNFDEQL
jgi:hypothetical protein